MLSSKTKPDYVREKTLSKALIIVFQNLQQTNLPINDKNKNHALPSISLTYGQKVASYQI
jgi:hypothetical protein